MATPSKKSGATPSKKAGKSAGKGGKSRSQSTKAGLVFPVGRIGSLLRRGRYAKRVSAAAAVYLAAVLEYLVAETLELAGKVKSSNNRITPRRLTMAVRHDADLSALLKDVTLSRGGIVPNVHKALEKKQKKAKAASTTPRV